MLKLSYRYLKEQMQLNYHVFKSRLLTILSKMSSILNSY